MMRVATLAPLLLSHFAVVPCACGPACTGIGNFVMTWHVGAVPAFGVLVSAGINSTGGETYELCSRRDLCVPDDSKFLRLLHAQQSWSVGGLVRLPRRTGVSGTALHALRVSAASVGCCMTLIL